MISTVPWSNASPIIHRTTRRMAPAFSSWAPVGWWRSGSLSGGHVNAPIRPACRTRPSPVVRSRARRAPLRGLYRLIAPRSPEADYPDQRGGQHRRHQQEDRARTEEVATRRRIACRQIPFHWSESPAPQSRSLHVERDAPVDIGLDRGRGAGLANSTRIAIMPAARIWSLRWISTSDSSRSGLNRASVPAMTLIRPKRTMAPLNTASEMTASMRSPGHRIRIGERAARPARRSHRARRYRSHWPGPPPARCAHRSVAANRRSARGP